ncbi:MAG: isopeptide-forming domain-containing fimbrial protein [Chloroflexota bacterium]
MLLFVLSIFILLLSILVGLWQWFLKPNQNVNRNAVKQSQNWLAVRLCLAVIAYGMIGIFTLVPAVFAMGPDTEVTLQKTFVDNSTSINVDSGEEFTYVLLYACRAIVPGTDCENVVITDTLPSGLDYRSVSGLIPPATASYNDTTRDVVFDLGTVNDGDAGAVELTVRFTPGSPPSTPPAVNTAIIDADNADPYTSNGATATVNGGIFEMQAGKSTSGDFDDTVVGDSFMTEYVITVSSPDEVGGLNLTNPEVVDQLPASATYIGSDPAGVYDPVTHVVTWTYTSNGGTLPDLIQVGEVFNIEVTVQFHPDGPDGIPGNADDPGVGADVTNNATITGTPEEEPASTGIGPVGDTSTLIPPYYSASINKSASTPSSYTGDGTKELAGNSISYDLSVANQGTVDMTDVVVRDTLTDVLDLQSFTMAAGITGTYSVNGGAATLIPGTPFAMDTLVLSTTLGLSAGDYVSELVWYLGDIPFNSDSWSATINATLDSGLATGTMVDNCAVLETSSAADQTACDAVVIIEPRSIPRPEKSVSSGPYAPEQAIDYTLRVVNDSVAHQAFDTPVTLADLLPEELEVIIPDATATAGYRAAVTGEDWFTFTASDGVAVTPTAVISPNFSGTQTLVRWQWTDGGYQLAPGESLEITFQAWPKKGTPPTPSIPNAAILFWGETTTNPLVCNGTDGNASYVDSLDIDGDGNTAEAGCQTAPTSIEVSAILKTESEKFVFGEKDTVWNKDGWTIPSGDIRYRMHITNTSNVTIERLIAYDIFPHVGDTGVSISTLRESQWRPNLQTSLTTTAGIPFVVQYSRSTNPCRPELVAGGPAGCVDDWSTTPPAELTEVQAVRLEFCDAIGGSTCYELGPDDGTGNGGAIELTWLMAAPNGAPQSPSRAWNSFAYTAFGSGLKLLPAEPNKVGIRLTTTVGITLGDYVWFDVFGQQNDGIQQPEEEGINGIRVELYDDLGNPVDADSDGVDDFRITGPDNNGDPGYYLFNELTPGNTYRVRFYIPVTYTVDITNASGDLVPVEYARAFTATLSNVGDDSLDSDGVTFGSDPTHGPYIETDLITTNILTPTDLSWDQGVWLNVDYGDAPADLGYPTRAISLTNPADAARHVIVPGLYMGSQVDGELDGPIDDGDAFGDDVDDGNDDEDGVTFDQYAGTAAQPIGVMLLGSSPSMDVSTVVPSGQTAYLNAWIDFNGDGDWDDAGEQIATDLATTGATETISGFTVPSSVTTYTTYARFRLSTETGLTPYAAARDGEIEDYRVVFVGDIEKSLSTTSEAHTSGNDAAIGEIVRYRLEVSLPEGNMSNFQITDNLPDGLQFLNEQVAVSYVVDTSVTSTSFTINGAPFSDGTDPIFNFGTVTNNDKDGDEELLIVEFNALVLNVAGNQDGTSLDNDFDVSYGTYSDTSNTVTVDIVEPDISNLDKSVTTTPNDAGDQASYQITYSNTGSTTAFDVDLTDVLDSTYFTLNVASVSVTPTGGSSGVTDNSSGNTVDVTLDTVPVGGGVTISYDVTLNHTVIPSVSYDNTADVVYTSLPNTGTTGNTTGSDTPGNSGDSDGERNGDGGVNDYSDTDDASVTIDDPSLTKFLVSTSEDHTSLVSSRENLAIGEIARFKLVAEIPEGTSPWLQFQDRLPDGLQFLNDDTATVAFVANGGGITSTTLISNTIGCDGGANPDIHFNGNDASAVTPTCLLPDNAVGNNNSNFSDSDTYNDGTDIYFKFGNIVNSDDDADAEFVIVEFNAIALNVTGNQAGTEPRNRFRIRIDTDGDNNSDNLDQSNYVNLRIAEPEIIITKSLIAPTVDAGDTISYTINFTNTATGDAAAAAFDVVMTDTLDTNLTLVGVPQISAPVGRTVTDTTSVPNVNIEIDRLDPGESVSVVLTATVSATVPGGQNIPNTAYVIYTSLPGPTGTTTISNTTGSTTPGSTSDQDGERDGSDGDGGALNDYADEDEVSFITRAAIPAKLLESTSAAHTSGIDVTIGEVVTYSLVVAIPEGIVPTLTITDHMPAGLAYNGQHGFDYSAFAGAITPGDPVVSPVGATTSGQPVIFQYTNPITNPANNDPSDNIFTITLQAVVTDVVGNVGLSGSQTDLINQVTIQTGNATPQTSPPITVTVVEPSMLITKTITPNSAASGETITVTLEVANVGLSTAFDVVVEDPLPSDTFINISNVSSPDFNFSTSARPRRRKEPRPKRRGNHHHQRQYNAKAE